MDIGYKEAVKTTWEMFVKQFDYDNEGHLKEYVGSTTQYTADGGLMFTQPVLMESYIGEFDIDINNVWMTLAKAGSELNKFRTPLSH